MTDSVGIKVILITKPGKNAPLRRLLETLVQQSRSEPGVLRYDLWADQTTDARFLLDAVYADATAFRAHLATSHFHGYADAIDALAVHVAIMPAPLDVIRDLDGPNSLDDAQVMEGSLAKTAGSAGR